MNMSKKPRWNGLPSGWITRAAGALVASALVLSVPTLGSAFAPVGIEYPGAGQLAGDQLAPSLAFDTSSGVVVWQDHSVGNSWTIRARRLSASGVGLFAPFTVPSATRGDQTYPQVAQAKGGNALIVWRESLNGKWSIFGRILKPGLSTPSFAGTNVPVSSVAGNLPSAPSVAALEDGTFVVVWTSDQADGDRFGVLAQHIGGNGEVLGTNFVVTQTFRANQRGSVVCPLSGSTYAIGWISENQRFDKSADVYGRTFSASGNPLTDEFRLNSGTNICSAPHLAAVPGGGFLAGWTERDQGNTASLWSVAVRAFDASGNSATPALSVVSDASHNANNPKLAVAGNNVFLTWRLEGSAPADARPYGQFLTVDGTVDGDSFSLSAVPLLNESVTAVVPVGTDQFVAAWTGFKNVSLGTEVLLRRFVRSSDGTSTFPQPVVASAVSSGGKVHLSWPTTTGGAYQISSSTNLKVWTNSGAERVAVSSSDSLDISPDSTARFFRVIRTR
jgi:hypothetical protein